MPVYETAAVRVAAETVAAALTVLCGRPACLVDAGESLRVITGELATVLADEMSMDDWDEAVPPCPGHGHPRRQVRRGDSVVWQCPRDQAHAPVLLIDCGR